MRVRAANVPTWALAVVACVLALAARARADEPVPAPPAAPAAPPAPAAPAGPTEAAKPASKPMTLEQLETRLLSKPGAAIAMAGLKYLPAVAGLIVIILALVKRGDRIKYGLIPARTDAAPPRAFGLGSSTVLLVAAVISGELIVLPIYMAMTGRTDFQDFPLWVGVLSTGLGSIAVAIAIASATSRAWSRRRADALAASDEFELTSLPTSAWPAGAGLRTGCLAALAATTIVFAVSLVTTLVLHQLGHPPELQNLVLRVIDPREPYEPWLIALFGVFVAPITEEFVFRGMVYPAIRDRTSKLRGAIFASLLFAGVHMSWTAGPALFALAVLLCWLYERTGSIWPGVLVHAFNNATSLLPLFLLK